MSRLRRLVLFDHFFFVTCRLLRRRRLLPDPEFACLARVIAERRRKHGFLLTAWVFLPDPCSLGASGALPAWRRPREGPALSLPKGGDPPRRGIPACAGMTRRGRAAPALQAQYAKTISPALPTTGQKPGSLVRNPREGDGQRAMDCARLTRQRTVEGLPCTGQCRACPVPDGTGVAAALALLDGSGVEQERRGWARP